MNHTALRCHSLHGLQPGPRLIVLGAVHGNETCGTVAIERTLAELDRGELAIVRGTVTFVPVSNPLAYGRGERSGERNLNRNLRPKAEPQDFEDRIGNVLCGLLQRHDVLLDLHSFHTPGEPFAMIGPKDNGGPLEPFARAAEEEALALCLGPQRIVEGWLEAYAEGVAQRLQRGDTDSPDSDPRYGIGTTEYMRTLGGYGITLECGQHADPRAPQGAHAAIRNTLALLGLIDAPRPPAQAAVELLRLSEVVDRLHEGDRLLRPWASFDTVEAGTAIGVRHDGTPVRAPADGHIVFPNPAASPGHEWFYFARRSRRSLRT